MIDNILTFIKLISKNYRTFINFGLVNFMYNKIKEYKIYV